MLAWPWQRQGQGVMSCVAEATVMLGKCHATGNDATPAANNNMQQQPTTMCTACSFPCCFCILQHVSDAKCRNNTGNPKPWMRNGQQLNSASHCIFCIENMWHSWRRLLKASAWRRHPTDTKHLVKPQNTGRAVGGEVCIYHYSCELQWETHMHLIDLVLPAFWLKHCHWQCCLFFTNHYGLCSSPNQKYQNVLRYKSLDTNKGVKCVSS